MRDILLPTDIKSIDLETVTAKDIKDVITNKLMPYKPRKLN